MKRSNGTELRRFLRTLFQQDWIVSAKPPFGGPEHVLHYLARYTHRVAISNHRLLAISDSAVSFRWKDYAHGSKPRTMTLSPQEFLRRFLQHVLPRGFPRIRYFGWLANRRRNNLLPLCRILLNQQPPATDVPSSNQPATWQCPLCQGPMYVIQRLTLSRSSSRKPDSHVLMTRPDRSLNPATLAGISPCSLNVCPALQNKPSCPAIGLSSMAWVLPRCALSMSSQLYLWRYSPALPIIDAVENP